MRPGYGVSFAWIGPMINAATALQDSYSIAPVTDDAEWDGFVEKSGDGTFCHLSSWRYILSGVMGHEACYVAARGTDGKLAGVLPLVRLRSRLFGERYVSVPYLNDGGPVGRPAAVAALIAHARALAGRGVLELRMRSAVPCGASGNGAVAAGGLPGSTDGQSASGKVTVLLDLPSDPAKLWSRLPSKVRSQVRRPQKAGLVARFGADQLRAFYDVWSQNMRDLGTPVLPRRFFETIQQAMPQRFVLGCIYRDNVPVAAGAGFVFCGEFEITWASSLRRYSREAPNMLLYWEFMSHAIERGARRFNFGRCTPGEGTHRFKEQWGGETLPLPWLSQPAATNGRPGRIAHAASAAWQRLPLPVANALGPAVARQLPWW